MARRLKQKALKPKTKAEKKPKGLAICKNIP